MDLKKLYDRIQDADMVLVGIGEEFNDISSLKKQDNYQQGRVKVEEECLWMLPAYDGEVRRQMTGREEQLRKALYKLQELLKDKNYFVISVAFNDILNEIPWKDNRLVRPCGGSDKKQCMDGCMEGLMSLTEEDRAAITEYVTAVQNCSDKDASNHSSIKPIVPKLGICPDCGKPLILNNVYAEHYDENGYLPQWQLYTKWLQGTLNRKVLILELGVGMKYPSVIRFPFEKVAYFNQKAYLYRVNENLYQLSEEIKEKGLSVANNSIDWLLGMC